ncbi:DUF3889 domain-containing protein [Bacillus pinisoli]|uniref:DUF3889 domain-containing protein n=1 Tax=Bacillus pinisoli TaxID=2901866 RepID=UPI001FF2C7CD|nr:DUF3889 domain-containing protein [Bacillus pinisoli]
MNKKIAFPLITLAFLIGLSSSYFFQDSMGIAQQPDYAKWSKMAVNVMNENYAEQDVSDFKYEGRKQISDTKSEDSFLFEVTSGDKKFNVRVVVTFNPKTDTLQSLQLSEVQ